MSESSHILHKISGNVVLYGVASDTALTLTQARKNSLCCYGCSNLEMTSINSLKDRKSSLEKHTIKGILKGAHSNARVMLICEGPGTQFDNRSLQLFKNREYIGRCSQSGGELPDEVCIR